MIEYAQHEHHDFPGAARQALADAPLQAALIRLTGTLMAGNRRGFAALADSSQLRDHAKHIKEHTLAHLDRYLEQLEASVKERGGHVHWAASAEDARRIVVDIARQAGCKRAVKSKSMTTEEVHLNPALQQAGVEVVETDFGEFIIQLAGERPSHLVAPAVHHTRESIARILSRHTGETLPNEPKALAQVGRRLLRDKFYRADLGITGANFAVAETGTIVLVTNEGNGRLTTTCPRVHVALVGIEKVIPRLADLPVFLKLLARAATGQTLSVYTTLLTGPRRPPSPYPLPRGERENNGSSPLGGEGRVRGELDGPEEFHLVLLDNGRTRILGSPFRESLQCIRCGACLNACPVYRRIGGHAYGGVYSGPIGSILTPLYDSVADNPDLPHASSLCGACQAACPVKINIPHMLIGLRELQHEGKAAEKGHPGRRGKWTERLAYRLAREVLSRPWLYRLVLRFARFFLRIGSKDGWRRRMPGAGAGWTQARDFPAPAVRSFRERWSDMTRSASKD
jgi:L-lactate dehydrogenase complex protein LldF